MAEPPPPGAARSWRPIAVVASALAAVLLLAALADGRLLVADPDPSVVTDADVALARSLFSDVTPPEALAEACFGDDGTIDPTCLGDGRPGASRLPAGGDPDPEARVVPRSCREDRSIDADCLERELGIDVPEACADESGRLDVGCLAESGQLVTLTGACLEGGRVRAECLEGRQFGVPDPGDLEGTERDPLTPTARPTPTDPTGGPSTTDPDRDVPEPVTPEPEEESGLAQVLALLTRGIGLLLLVVLVLILLAAGIVAATRWRPGPIAPAEPGDEDEDEHDRAVIAASLDASARRLDLSGDPRQAIIAAYALLLEGLAACAQARHPAETPLEHLERVLAALDVRPEPLRELTTLFGEARFSDHAMTDVQRDRARAALEAAASDLQRVRETVG